MSNPVFLPQNAGATVITSVSEGDVIGVPTEYLQLTVELDLNMGVVLSLLFVNGDSINNITIEQTSFSMRRVDC